MIHPDTVRLLRECDAGAAMGVKSIEDVLGRVPPGEFADRLAASRREHEELIGQIRSELERFGDEGRAPSPIARGMAHVKAAAELAISPSEQTAAGLITDGCGMGVKSLNGYLNEYTEADERSKDIAKRLIALEEALAAGVRDFL